MRICIMEVGHVSNVLPKHTVQLNYNFIFVWKLCSLCVYTILVCNGRLQLFSSEHNQGMYIQPADLRNTKRNKKKLKKYYSSNEPFDLARLEGNCCWKVWSRYRSGQSFGMGTAKTYQPGWNILSVQLVESCNLE